MSPALISEKLKANIALRVFGIAKVPMIAFVKPVVDDISDLHCKVRIPIRRRTRNHYGSLYFGSFAVGADCAGGLLAMHLIKKSGAKINLLFKDFKAQFLKRPEGDVTFVCSDGAAIRSLIEHVVASKERGNLALTITATEGEEPQTVAIFELTLSLK